MSKSTVPAGLCQHIDWDHCIEQLSILKGIEVTTDPSRWNLNTSGYQEIYDIWQRANFNAAAIKWTNYYPDQHFPNELPQQLANYLNVNIHRAWISRVDPGYCAPWHWDVDDNEQEYLKNGDIKRYSCFIEKPVHGHIFIIGDDYLYNQPQGTIVQWKNYKEWHSGINAGMSPKYMLHLLAY